MSDLDLVLASGSPRRRAFLADLGLRFQVDTPGVDEVRRPGEAPAAFARRVACEKAEAVASRRRDGLPVLAADTTVVLGERVLGKPADAEEAAGMLRRLAGHVHEVVTGIALHAAGTRLARVVSTRVHFRPLSEAEIGWYVATGEPFDAAGAYKIQERGAVLVADIAGSHSNVIGLPLAETLALLAEAGVRLPWEGTS